MPKSSNCPSAAAMIRSVVVSTGVSDGAPSFAVCKIGSSRARSIYPRTEGKPLSRLNPLHDLTHPLGNLEQSMVRLEGAIGDLSTELKPVNVLPEVLASLQR